MQLRKSILSCLAIFWSRAKFWSDPLQAYGFIHRAYMRRKLATNFTFGILVYVFKSDYDLSKGLVLLQDSFSLIKEKSPVLVESLKRVYKSIILYIGGSRFRYFHMDQCLMINALTLPKLSESQQKIYWAVEMISIARAAALLQGRHGYIGIRFVEILRTKAEIRFVRKCIGEENHLFLLSALNLMNKRIDKLRPERRYYERFLKHDLPKLSFGKKLAVAADGIGIVDVEASDLNVPNES
jgi:hypothetical protein